MTQQFDYIQLKAMYMNHAASSSSGVTYFYNDRYDNHKFKIGRSNQLGSNVALSIDTDGLVSGSFIGTFSGSDPGNLWTATGNDIYYNTGDVGIGTTNPFTYAGFNTLTINHETNGGVISLQQGGVEKAQIYSFSEQLYLKADDNINFYVDNEPLGDPQNLLTLDGGGKYVSIKPGSEGNIALRVNGEAEGTGYRYLSLGLPSGVPTITAGIGGTGDAELAFKTSNSSSGEAERMRIDVSGNVGIGDATVISTLSSSDAPSLTIAGGDGSDDSFCLLRMGKNLEAGTNNRSSRIEFVEDISDASYPSRMNWGAFIHYDAHADETPWGSGAIYIGMRDNSTEDVNVIGIGRDAPASSLDIKAGGLFTTNLPNDVGTYPVKWDSATDALSYDGSSRKFKKNIRDLVTGSGVPPSAGVDLIKQLRPVMYDHKSDGYTDRPGMVAEEVAEVHSSLVRYAPDMKFDANGQIMRNADRTPMLESDNLVAANYDEQAIMAQLIVAIQQLDTRLAVLEAWYIKENPPKKK